MNKAYTTKWVKISIIMICKEETNIGRIKPRTCKGRRLMRNTVVDKASTQNWGGTEATRSKEQVTTSKCRFCVM
jgi:hypothetical protein